METPDYTQTELDISDMELTELPDDLYLYPHLQILKCYENNLTQCDNLPQSLKILECWYNKITQLNNLPTGLDYLNCADNPLEYNFEPTLENIRNYVASLG